MPKIIINDEIKELPESSTIATVIENMEIEKLGIAIAVNNQVIKKVMWSDYFLNDGDKILIIKAAQGG